MPERQRKEKSAGTRPACTKQPSLFAPARTRRACLEVVIGAGKPGQGGLDVCELETLIVFPRPTKCDDKRLLQLVPRLVWGEKQTVIRLAAIAMEAEESLDECMSRSGEQNKTLPHRHPEVVHHQSSREGCGPG